MLNILRKLLNAAMFKSGGKLKPVHALGLVVALVFYGWQGSPYFMLYIVGPPEPGTAPRFIGTLREEGTLVRTRNGWIPPRYFIATSTGEIEVHCGYRPRRTECHGFSQEVRKGLIPIQVGHDNYWGIDYIKSTPKFAYLDDRGSTTSVAYRRFSHLQDHKSSAIIFCLLVISYLALVAWTFLSLRSKLSGDQPKQN
jgi:hypothetical protein